MREQFATGSEAPNVVIFVEGHTERTETNNDGRHADQHLRMNPAFGFVLTAHFIGIIAGLPGEVSVSGTVTGKTAIQSWFRNLMNCGPSVHFTLQSVAVENILDFVGTNIVCAEWENAVTS